MKVYIMTDMEGVAGVLDHDNWCQPPERGYPGRYYDAGRELLSREVNACVAGLSAAGALTIIVADGHGAGGIVPMLLDRRAQLLRGWPSGWPLELDASFDAVVWVGQHAKAGTVRAHLAHTQWFNYLDQTINGISIGEFGQFALCASELGVPAIFASGDEALCAEATALAQGITTAAVKRGLQPRAGDELDTQEYMRHNLAAVHLHPEVACRAIEDRARAALLRLRHERPGYGLVHVEPPYERVTRFRPERPGEPARIDRATHPDSIIALLNAPFDPQPV
ncbi:MAG: M55 family metallopeptidase [Anaerolineae bacterium]|nr:M55 family metallopeptidase [Anaerolineae bacterium]